MSDSSMLRWCGAAGLSGAALLLAADWLLLGTFTGGQELRANWLPMLAAMPRWRLLTGGLAGPVGAWLYVVGFWQTYIALRPAGRLLAFTVFAGFSLSFVWIAGAFHTSFPFMADAWRTMEAAGAPAEAIAGEMFAYGRLLYVGGLPPAVAALALLGFANVCRRTLYPRWFVLLNPLLIFLCFMPFQWMPAPLGGLLAIGAGNLTFLVFFAASTAVLWHAGRDRRDRPERDESGRSAPSSGYPD
jgi:hypothetical protein